MSLQKQDAASVKVAICGISGSGKTTLFEKLIRREKGVRWVFVYDHKQGDMARRFGVKPCFDGESLERAMERGKFVCFNPSLNFAGKKAEGFKFFCKLVWAIAKEFHGKKILAVDELDALVDARREPEELCEILDEGRTFELQCFFIMQAMNGIHNQVRKQLTEIFCMIQGDKNGLEFFEERGMDVAEIKTLKHGEFIYQNKNTGQLQRGGKAFRPKNAGRDLRGL
jgi:hypothetical protein